MAKKDKVKIDKINIKIGDQEIPMTLAQAKELQELLNDTFGKTYRLGNPIYIERPVRPWRSSYNPLPYWGVSYDSNTVVFSTSSGGGAPSAAKWRGCAS